MELNNILNELQYSNSPNFLAGMALASVTVVTNALRLRHFRPSQ